MSTDTLSLPHSSHTSHSRDKDGDGRLNKQELREWIMPENYDHAKAEATHLIDESDVDSVSSF